MTTKEVKNLTEKYLAGGCTPEEIALLETWYLEHNEAEPLDISPEQVEISANHVWEAIIESTADPRQVFRWRRYAAAASLIIGISVLAYFTTRRPAAIEKMDAPHREELAPVNNGVVLTMPGDKRLILGNRHAKLNSMDGSKAEQSGETLAYEQTAGDEAPVIHTLTNNSGKKYTLILADGTKAYLDAASSITYPVAFKGDERKVSVTGQVYFKVEHDAAMPFRVIVKDEVIEDIGTEFNINAYDDESALTTTLIRGAVRIKRDKASILLKPGQQTQSSGTGLSVKIVDVEATTAWLQGKLIFDNEALESIMKRVARIYGVNIVWVDDSTRQLKFGGSLNYSKKLSTVLNYFRKTGGGSVDFSVEGKTVKIFKKNS